MGGPLAGIRIVELGQMIAVPAAAGLLAAQGASVVKVENVAHGDELRFYGSRKNGLSAWFVSANSGKRSIALDLTRADGAAVLWRLLGEADVLMEGFRPGVMSRLGFGPEAVRERFPSLIYFSSSGYGREGPYAGRPAYDPVIQALSGWATLQADGENPSLVRAAVADKVAALTGAQAVTAALVQRGRTGHGQHVDQSMLDANIAFNWSDAMMHCALRDGDAEHRPNLLRNYRLFRCADGWMTVAAGSDRQWHALCEGLDRPDLASDPRFATTAARSANGPAWYDAMGELVAPFTTAEIMTRVGDDLPVAPVLEAHEVATDPHIRARGSVREVVHPLAGRIHLPRQGARFEGAGDEAPTPAPLHGEHSLEILAELGYGEADRRQLIAEGAVHAGTPQA